MAYEQSFKNIDNLLRTDEGCAFCDALKQAILTKVFNGEL